MSNKPTTQWIIDAALFGGFLLSLWLDLTGLVLHQWLGVAVGALAIYHLAAHGRWVVAVSQRFFGRTSRQARAFYAVDAALAAGFTAMLVTGLAISTWFDLDMTLTAFETWRTAHIVASVAMLVAVIVKIGLHWRWIVTTARKRILPAPARRPGTLQPVPVTFDRGRRDFLRLMAGTGAVALLSGLHALDSLMQVQPDVASAPQPANTQTGALPVATPQAATSQATTPQATAAPRAAASATATPQATATSLSAASASAASQATPSPVATPKATAGAQASSSASSSASTTCTVRCPRRCSYPGRCQRYTDSNGNGRCDLGECVS